MFIIYAPHCNDSLDAPVALCPYHPLMLLAFYSLAMLTGKTCGQSDMTSIFSDANLVSVYLGWGLCPFKNQIVCLLVVSFYGLFIPNSSPLLGMYLGNISLPGSHRLWLVCLKESGAGPKHSSSHCCLL